MIAVDQARAVGGNDGLQPKLAFCQRCGSQVFSVTPKQIERNKARFTASEKQFSELQLAFAVEADNFAIENRKLCAKLRGKSSSQFRD